MAKKVLSKQMECISISKQVNRAVVNFADGVSQNDKGATAKNIITVNFSDPKNANSFEVGQSFTIEISE